MRIFVIILVNVLLIGLCMLEQAAIYSFKSSIWIALNELNALNRVASFEAMIEGILRLSRWMLIGIFVNFLISMAFMLRFNNLRNKGSVKE